MTSNILQSFKKNLKEALNIYIHRMCYISRKKLWANTWAFSNSANNQVMARYSWALSQLRGRRRKRKGGLKISFHGPGVSSRPQPNSARSQELPLSSAQTSWCFHPPSQKQDMSCDGPSSNRALGVVSSHPHLQTEALEQTPLLTDTGMALKTTGTQCRWPSNFFF